MPTLLHHGTTATLAMALVALGPLGSASPQAPAPRDGYAAFLDQVEVDVINVDLLVVDRAGRPVLDLGRDELELLVDGRPVPITYFAPPPGPAATPSAPAAPAPGAATAEPAAGTAPAPEAAIPPPPGSETDPGDAGATREATTVVVYVDQTTIGFSQRARVLRTTRELITSRLPSAARVMVATYDTQLQVLGDLTADRGALATAFDTIGDAVGRGQAARAEERLLLQELDIAQNQREGTKEGYDLGRQPEQEAEMARAMIEAAATQEIARQRGAIRALGNLLAMLGGLDGRKIMVLASGGLASRPGGRLADLWEARFGHLGVPAPRVGSEGDADTQALQDELARLQALAQATRVTLITVDASEGSAGGIEAASVGSAERPAARATLAADEETRASLPVLADATGGRALRSGPRLDEDLALALDQLANSYSLGFAGGPELGDGYHRLEVRALREGLTTRHREGFRRRSARERAADATLAAAAFAAAGEDPLGAEIVIGEAQRGADRKAKTRIVPLRIQFPLANLTLIPEGDRQVGRVTLHLALRDAEGRIGELAPHPLPVAVPNDRLSVALDQLLAFDVNLPLAAGEHRLAAIVHDELGDLRSTVILPVVVLP
jgi:VWFA-related protein